MKTYIIEVGTYVVHKDPRINGGKRMQIERIDRRASNYYCRGLKAAFRESELIFDGNEPQIGKPVYFRNTSTMMADFMRIGYMHNSRYGH
ncbi:hypothetical protein SAMN05216436_1397 [bacterium A37T11]|nr:hypothetical protein SAMN05216436_1397 [bacterium A37T11]